MSPNHKIYKIWGQKCHILEQGTPGSFLAIDVTRPYKFIRFGAIYVTKPYKFIRFGAIYVTKPYEIYEAWGPRCHQTL